MASLNCYSLLADESCAFSRDSANYPAFLAHLVYVLILNDEIVLSDNQIVSSPNLRRIFRENATLRAAAEHDMVALAIRLLDDASPPCTVHDVHQAFRREGKLVEGTPTHAEGPELAFFEERVRKVPYAYWDVRTHFTTGCSATLKSHFQHLLGDGDHDRFCQLIDGEIERDQGLGRKFLWYDLEAAMRDVGIRVPGNAQDLIRHCTDAHYVSNLPRLLDLNPTYGEEHRPSFELIRGGALRYEDVGPEEAMPFRLSYEHFVHGLLELDIDDILELRAAPARSRFAALQRQGVSSEADLVELELAYRELNREIEARIFLRSRHVSLQSPEGMRMTVRRQRATGTGLLLDTGVELLALAVNAVPFASMFLSRLLIDPVKKRLEGPDRPQHEPALFEMRREQLARGLTDAGNARRIGFDERSGHARFARETMVR